MALSPEEVRELQKLVDLEVAARCHDDLATYAAETLGMPPAKHHRLLCEGLEQIERGELDLLLVMMPPGSAKSSYGSVVFPAWYLGRHPDRCVIAASHTAELAERFGRRVRNIIATAENERIFNRCKLSTDSTAAGRWDTSAGGEYFATGIGGAVTGRRADCLLFNTLVSTPRGVAQICDIQPGDEVLSYAEHEHRAVYRRVVAVARRKADEYWRIRTVSGRVVEATGNHRFYVGGAWKTAQALAVGDVFLRALPENHTPSELRIGQEGSSNPELSPCMLTGLCDQDEQFDQGNGGAKSVQSVRTCDPIEAPDREERLCLLRQMQVGIGETARGPVENGSPTQLQCVRKGLQADNEHVPIEVLLQEVCGDRSLGSNAVVEQPELAARQGSEQVSGGQRPQVQAGQEGGADDGQLEVRGVLELGEVAGTSHRRGQHEQRAGESGDALSVVPHDPAWGRTRETATDTVAMVERVCQDAEVYDIQVEGTECFFAGGLLVHNCAIIDDPVKSREDADSETIREKQWSWWRDDLMTRLKPNAAVVLIMTRWHEADLAGRILEDVKGTSQRVRVIEVPMEAGEHDELGRQPGELLWPEWFTPAMVEQAKREPRTWTALYQQKPRPIGGGEFKLDWLCYYARHPQATNRVLLVDPASGKFKTRGDYTSMWVLGIGPDGNEYILDGVRDRINLTERTDKVFELVRRWKPSAVGYEEYGLQADIEHIRTEQERQQYRFRVIPLGGGMKKEDRIRRLIPSMQQGKLWMPRSMLRPCSDGHQRDVIEDLKNEMLSFPVGAHDDAIDCLARKEEPEIRKYLTIPQDSGRAAQASGAAFSAFDSQSGY